MEINEDNPTPRKTIQMTQCLESAFAEGRIEEYSSPITGERLGATQNVRMGSFPNFLLIQLQVRRLVLADRA
jgi:hypothetical protein